MDEWRNRITGRGSENPDIIHFTAPVSKVQTLADGGIRITLDLCEDAIKQAGELMQVKQNGAVLEIAAIPVEVVKEKKWRDPQD